MTRLTPKIICSVLVKSGMLKTQSLVRIRPALGKELLLPHTLQVETNDRTISIAGSRDFSLTCDRVLSPGFTQQLVFNTVVQPMIDDSLLEDRIPVLFIFGPPHSGKSYTVEGNQNDDALAGVLYNSIAYLFANDAAEVYVSSLGFASMERIRNLLSPSEQPQEVTPLFNQRAYPSVTYPCCAYPLIQTSDIVDLVRLSRRHAARIELSDWMHKVWILDYQIQGQYGRFAMVELTIFPSPRGSDLLLQSLLVRVMNDIRNNRLDVLPIREHKLLSCLRDSFHSQLGSVNFLFCISQIVKQEDLESNMSLLYILFPYTKDSIPGNKALADLINSKVLSPRTSLHSSRALPAETALARPPEPNYVHLPEPGASGYYAEIGERYKESCKSVSLNYIKGQLEASNRILQSIIDDGKGSSDAQIAHREPGPAATIASSQTDQAGNLDNSTSTLAATHTSITATPQILRHDRVPTAASSGVGHQLRSVSRADLASQSIKVGQSPDPDTSTAIITATKVIKENTRGSMHFTKIENRPLDPELARAPTRAPAHSPSTFDDSLVPQTVALPIRSLSAQNNRRLTVPDREVNLQLTPVRPQLPATPSSAIHLGKSVGAATLTTQSINFERDQQLEQLRQREEDAVHRIHALELNLKKKDSQLKQMEVLLKDALQQNEAHLIKMESMGKMLDELRSRPQITVHQLATKDREEYEARVAALSDTIVQKDNEIHSLHLQAEKLRGLLNQSTRFQAYADSLGTTLEPSQQLLDERVDAMLVDMASKDKQIADLARENDEVQQLLHKMRGDLADHERTLGDLGYYKGLSTELGNMKLTLSAEIEQLKAENEVFRLENQRLHDEISKVRDDYHQVQLRATRAQEATEEVADLSQRYVELERKYEDVVRESHNARTESASKDATIETLSRQVGYLKGIEKTLTHLSGAMTQMPMDATVRVPITSSGFNPDNHPRELDILSHNISEIRGRD